MKAYAVLFGINYDNTPARLRGCVNDVMNVSKRLREYHFQDVRVFTDKDRQTTANGLLQEMNNLAVRSWRENLDLAWIHFSGHGCSVRDVSGDEKDGLDECIVPRDYNRVGVIPDDYIRNILRNFNPKTRVVCVFDCCHSGTVGDLKYRYINANRTAVEHGQAPCRSPILLISGCRDNQTSADAFNVNNAHQFSGAMTSCLLQCLENKDPNTLRVHDLLNDLRVKLRENRFTQVPQLCSSFIVNQDTTLF
jgi:hypothetical protein